MIRFVFRRLIIGLIALTVFSFVMFWMVEVLIPGDFFSGSRLFMSADEVDALREQFGVDRAIHIRWWRWLIGFMTNGFGVSTSGFGVAGPLTDAFSRTVFVFFAGLLSAYAIGQWLGRVTGWRRGWSSDGITIASIGVSTLFPPFMGFLFLTFVGVRLRSLRASVFEDQRRTMWLDPPFSEPQLFDRMSMAIVLAIAVASWIGWLVWNRRRKRLPTSVIASIVVVIWAMTVWAIGIGPWALDLLFDSGLVLGAFTLLAFGEFLLIMQAGMASTHYDDYIATARAKGLKERTIRDRHAARNASLAVVARLAVSIPYLLSGLVIIERAVGFHGVGSFLFSAIEAQDVPLATSTLAAIGIITMIVRLVLDTMTAVLDPRIKVTGSAS